ncbi:hypothetical protein [Sulfurimonas sp.]
MLKILAQTVFSLILISGALLAKEIPMVREIDLYIPYKQFSVIEFPFKIKGDSFTPFRYKRKIIPNREKDIEPTIQKPTLKTKSNKKKVMDRVKKQLATKSVQATGPMTVAKGVNFFKLYPKKVGTTELLIWGYSKYPVMLHLHIVKNDHKSDNYIKFIDPSANIKEAVKFESSYHDRVVINITRALYNNKLPHGYKEDTVKKEFFIKGLHIVLTKRYLGKRYMGEEYIVENISSSTIALDSEMFEQNGIYGITFENSVLPRGKSTKLYVVREKNNV